MRSAALALLLGGCLIVRTHEDVLEDPCPAAPRTLLADAAGPFTLADAIYFIGANGTLSRVAFDGGPVSELTTGYVRTPVIAADATYLYWSSEGEIVRKPLAGGTPYPIAQGFTDVTALIADTESVVWASSIGLQRWDKTVQTVGMLDEPALILGLASYAGVYYYSATSTDRVRKAPPATDLATAHFPGPLVVDDQGVYFYEAADPFIEYGGALRLVPREGGSLVTTASDLAPVIALAAEPDDESLYFATAYGNEYRIKQVSRFGGTVRTLSCGPFEQQQLYLAVATPYIYVSDGRGLYRLAKPDDTPR